MKVISSHKTLFKNIAILGIIVLLFSSLLFILAEKIFRSNIETASKEETMYYANSLVRAASEYSDILAIQTAGAFEEQLELKISEREAISEVIKLLKFQGLKQVYICYLDNNGIINSCDTREDDIWLLQEFEKMKTAGIRHKTVMLKSDSYMLAYAPLTPKADMNYNKWIMLLLPDDALFAKCDWDGRIIGLTTDQSIGDYRKELNGKNVVLFPIADSAEKSKVFIKIRQKSLSTAEVSWHWEFLLIAIFPVFILLLVTILLYRYFRAFANHVDGLYNTLKSYSPEQNIFRRDKQVINKFMPELTDLFMLIDKNIGDNRYTERSLEIIKNSLDIIRDKGYEQKTIDEILEILVSANNGYGAAIISATDNDVSRIVYSTYKFDDILMQKIIKTNIGIGFLHSCVKNEQGLTFSYDSISASNEPWREIFSEYKAVSTRILKFRSQPIGILIMLFSESKDSVDLIGRPEEYLSELLSGLVYGINLEQEKSSRSDKTLILQETSLAISSTLDLSSLLRVVATRLTEYAGATYCIILLCNDTEDILEAASYYVKKQSVAIPSINTRIHLADFPKLNDAIKTNRAFVISQSDISDFTSSENEFFNHDAIKRLVVMPISHSGKYIGSVVLGDDNISTFNSFTMDKLNFIQALTSQASAAIENARLYGFINQKVDQLTALYNVGAAIHSEIDVNSMLDKVLTATRDYIHYSVAAICTIDEKTRIIKPIVSYSQDTTSGIDRPLILSNDSTAKLAVSTGESVIIEDTRLETNLKPSFEGNLSELVVPIKIGDKIIGVFALGSTKRNTFTQLEDDFLRALAAQIAVALERSRLFEQERERSLKLKTIYDFSRKLSETLNLQEVLKIACESILGAFGYQLVAIFLIDEKEQRFFVANQATSSDKKLPADFTLRTDEGMLGRVLSAQKTLYSANVESDPNYIKAVDEVRSEVCIPIKAADSVKGVLDVESMDIDGFTPEDIATLEAIADILAVAIDNSYLFKQTMEKAERLALIDNINRAISATLDLNSFFKVVAKAVADIAGYRWTLLIVPDGDSFSFKTGYTPKAVAGISPGPVLELLNKPLKKVMETGAPGFVGFSELASMKRLDLLQPLVEAGIRHMALLPIGSGDKTEAILTVGTSQSDGFSQQELSLLSDLALHLRIAWQNAQLYEQLKSAYSQLQEAQDHMVQTEKLRALGEMSSGVVHDFNNILAAISGRTQILLRKLAKDPKNPDPEFLLKNLTIIEKASNDGSHILSRISEFTKKKPTEKFVPINIDQVIFDAIEMTKPKWHHHALSEGKVVDVDFQRGGLLQTTGSPSELREVFTNLINNAVDAMGAKGKIKISANLKSENIIEIIMEDNGHGMSSDVKKRIFEPFFTTKGAKGTGLGLSVTYGIITRHSGSIEVESELGQGTKFKIQIPVRAAKSEEQNVKSQKENSGRVKSILVVDDENELREVLVEILNSNNYETDSAESGADALEKLKKKSYNIVITDLGMTDISGWELSDLIYRDYNNTKVILATGWGAQVEPGSLAIHHVNSLISKPFKITAILDAIEKVCNCSRDEVLVENS